MFESKFNKLNVYGSTVVWSYIVKRLFCNNVSRTLNSTKMAVTKRNTGSTSDYLNNSRSKEPTAGIIIIGDEILKGQTQDLNTFFITKQLYNLGVKVKSVVIIPDDLPVIAEEVSKYSKLYTHVITSGGIGPTHDDITYEGVAAAFDEKLVCHPVISDFIKKWFKTDDPSSPALKMAKIPESAELLYGENKELGIKSLYPTIRTHNVTILPGIPHLLQKAFHLLGKKLFLSETGEFCHSEMFFACDEMSIAAELNQTVKQFPNVTFGSYPELFHSYYRTKVTFEAPNQEMLSAAQNHLRSLIDKDSIVDYIHDTISEPWQYISNLDDDTRKAFESAMKIVQECFEKYSPEEICVCYNGGKDCLVALHLAHLYTTKHCPDDHRLQALYITEEKGFPQVNEFVNQSIVRYNLDCKIIAGPMKSALANLLSQKPRIKAVLMGTRMIDPHAKNMTSFTPTDGDWPSLMRVNPILDWKYDRVWTFIRQLYLPYCSLYDKGYTSIGNLDNTIPNPVLQRKDRIGRTIYLPAYELEQQELERKGRLF